MKSVTLYKTEDPYWSCVADVKDSGDLVVSSGDANNDWSKIVRAAHKPALLDALLKSVSIDAAAGDDADDRLLRALSVTYAGNDNPYDSFQAFLERHEIPARDLNWLWGGDQD